MSQRYLVPTNLFYHWKDPNPPEFPPPHTGDVYFNISSKTIRVFYEGVWNDVGGPSGGLRQDVPEAGSAQGLTYSASDPTLDE